MVRALGVFSALVGIGFVVLGAIRLSGLVIAWPAADRLAAFGLWPFFSTAAAFLAIGALALGCERIAGAVRTRYD